jgi:putative protease
MPHPTKSIELLAPAKNADIGIAAINCGADAVYIGAEHFSARQNAGNSLQDIERLIRHAHLYYARVYVTFNTLLKDEELDEALAMIRSLAQMGVDGIIIQDVGLLEFDLPPVPIIASTQMHNDAPEKVLFLEKIGLSRVILPRELTLSEIKDIRSKTSISLETFIHGALCVCYSGQCYLSYAIGGRSANRGACAQPCRQVYSLVDEQGKTLVQDKHLLSLKDMSRAKYLEDLIDAGVDSFKIEGRLKDINYVTNTVAFYRERLDKIIARRKMAKSSSGRTTLQFTPDIHKTFNRGFTDFCMTGQREQIASHNTPKSIGEKIGAVRIVADDHFTLAAAHDLHNGDGICFFDKSGTLQGAMINTVDGQKVYPNKMPDLTSGTVIYRNHDHAFIDRLSAKDAYSRKVPVTLTLSETEAGLALEIRDEDGNIGTASVTISKEAAQKPELAGSNIRKQLTKLNDTIFTAEHLTHNLRGMYFLPLAALNNLRREAVADLLRIREINRPRRQGKILQNDIPYPLTAVDFRANCLNQKAVSFYQRHQAKVNEQAAESGLSMQGRPLMHSKYCIKGELDLCHIKQPLFLVDEKNKKYRLEFDCKTCRMTIFEC